MLDATHKAGMITILLIIALVCLLLQALEINVKRISIGFLGLFFWCLAVALPFLETRAVFVGSGIVIVLAVVIGIVIIALIVRRQR